MSDPFLVTYLGVVHPWMCDVMGHMNVRHYAAVFDDASFQLLGHIAPPESLARERRGWADVRCEIDYKHETPAGTLLTVRSHLVRVGGKSLTFVHRLSSSGDETLRATARITTVCFDLAARRSIELDEAQRVRAMALLVAE